MNLILKRIMALMVLFTMMVCGTVGERDFASVKRFNIKGNLKVIGNTNVMSVSVGNAVKLEYVNVDDSISIFPLASNTFNSSFAVLEDSMISSPTAGKVKWAGLYWTGFLHTNTITDEKDYKRLLTIDDVKNEIENHSIEFYAAGDKHTIKSTKTNEIYFKYDPKDNEGYFYSCFADVTEYLQGKDPRAQYGTANIPSMLSGGPASYGADGDESGGWSLVVVYENDSVGEKTRNLSVFDGFKKIEGTATIDIPIKGFLTPKTATTIDSTLSAFAAGGTSSLNDGITFTNVDGTKAGQSVPLQSTQANDFFDSSITGVPNRDKNLERNQGIDIHTAQLGNVTADGYNIIGNNQRAANIKLYTTNDVYYPSVVAFATELYVPRFCYDYSVLLNDEMMQKAVGDRSFLPHRSSGVLMSKVFIRNLEGDFPFLNSTLKAEWSKDASSLATFVFKKPALVQNPHVYSYSEPECIDEINGKYYIGWEKDGYKGTIDALESVYAISNFDASNLDGSAIQLNIEVNASIGYDEDSTSLAHYTYSTRDGDLEICEGEIAYNPRWYQFNIESLGATDGNYALNTQVTGMNYNLQLTSYIKDAITGEYTDREPYTGAMEIEPFEIPSFQSLGSYDMAKYSFDRICEDSSNGKPWADNKSHFSLFENTETTPLGITKEDNKYAMRNAGVRAWVLMADYDGDGKLYEVAKNNNCVSTTDSVPCFKTLYAKDAYYPKDGKCATDCTSGSDEECYKCLKKYYAQPICSRDNFSVRPYGVQLDTMTTTRDGDGKITKEATIQRNDTVPTLIPSLISGFDSDYEARITAKSVNAQPDPTGYYFRKLATDIRDIPNNLFDSLPEFFGLKFDNSKINDASKDITKCDDSTHKRFDPTMSSWKLANDNVGNYDVLLRDQNWTIVDQALYKYKAPASTGRDDCIPKSTIFDSAVALQGCDVQSFEVNNDIKYNKIPVKYVPAKMDVQTIGKTRGIGNPDGNWLYMNTLTADNLDMSAKFAGTIVAQNAKQATTTNFTAGCFAQDVDLNLNYSSSDLDKDGKAISNIKFGLQMAQALNGANTIKNDPFVSEVIPETKTDTITTDKQLNLSTRDVVIGLPEGVITPAISKDEFLDSNKGSIAYDLRMSINKILDTLINPIETLFMNLKSKLHNNDGTPTEVYKAGYTPAELTALGDGATPNIVDNKQYYDIAKSIAEQSTTFIYGAIYTPLMIGATPNITALAQDIVLSVVGYCVNDTDAGIDCNDYSQEPYSIFEQDSADSTKSKETTAGWYRMVDHDADNDGEMSKIASNGVLATIDGATTKLNVKFDRAIIPNAGNTNDIILGYPMNGRDQLVEYTITPSVWLAHKIATVGVGFNPIFQIKWINPRFIWTGKGANVGSVVKMTPQPATKRLSW